MTGEQFLEMSDPRVTGVEAVSSEGMVSQGVPRVLASLPPEKLFKDVSPKESAGQQDATVSPTIPEISEEKPVPLVQPTVKVDKTPLEKLRESPRDEQTPFVTTAGGRGNEGVNSQPSRTTKVSFPVVYLYMYFRYN